MYKIDRYDGGGGPKIVYQEITGRRSIGINKQGQVVTKTITGFPEFPAVKKFLILNKLSMPRMFSGNHAFKQSTTPGGVYLFVDSNLSNFYHHIHFMVFKVAKDRIVKLYTVHRNKMELSKVLHTAQALLHTGTRWNHGNDFSLV